MVVNSNNFINEFDSIKNNLQIKIKSFLEQNGFNPSSESLMQDIVSSEEYIAKNGLEINKSVVFYGNSYQTKHNYQLNNNSLQRLKSSLGRLWSIIEKKQS